MEITNSLGEVYNFKALILVLDKINILVITNLFKLGCIILDPPSKNIKPFKATQSTVGGFKGFNIVSNI